MGVSIVPRSGVGRGGDLLLEGPREADRDDEADEGEERAVHEDARGGPLIRSVVRPGEDLAVDQQEHVTEHECPKGYLVTPEGLHDQHHAEREVPQHHPAGDDGEGAVDGRVRPLRQTLADDVCGDGADPVDEELERDPEQEAPAIELEEQVSVKHVGDLSEHFSCLSQVAGGTSMGEDRPATLAEHPVFVNHLRQNGDTFVDKRRFF